MTAGLLQLFFGCFGAGRFYLGLNQTATAQLCLGALGVLTGMLLIIGLPLLACAWIWGAIDAIMIFTSSLKDPYGRQLRSP